MLTITTYHEIDTILQAFNQGHLGFVIITSPPGLGKTQTATKTLNNTTRISGHITDLKLYTTLWENKNKNIWLDDIHQLTNNKEKRNLLINLCETTTTRTITWQTTKPLPNGIPTQFTTQSHILITANTIPNIDQNQDAITSRAHHINFQPTHTERINKIKTYATDTEITNHLQTITHRPITLRDYTKATEWKNSNQNWKHYLTQDHHTTTQDIIQHLTNTQTKQNENKTHPWKHLNISRRQYYKLKKQAQQEQPNNETP